MEARAIELRKHQAELAGCARCPGMLGKPVFGRAVVAEILLVGQAPGSREMTLARPFAWTAGKTLFGWFSSIGVSEDAFRRLVYMAAVCRCFPGKSKGGGDRVPSKSEVSNCSHWLERELELLQTKLVIPVGRLAIAQFLPAAELTQLIGRCHAVSRGGRSYEVIPLPHPSGASVWHRVEPGKTLLAEALRLVSSHPAWRALCAHAGQPSSPSGPRAASENRPEVTRSGARQTSGASRTRRAPRP
jgi:uracil-DNA glycosylase